MIIILQMSSGAGAPYFPAGYQSGYPAAQAQEVPPKPESPKPPKKPLTPYMRFSTSVCIIYLFFIIIDTFMQLILSLASYKLKLSGLQCISLNQ